MPTRGIRAGGHGALQPGQVLGIGQLDVVLRAGDDRHRLSDRLQQRSVIGRGHIGDGAVRLEQHLIAERLRGLSPVQPLAWHRGGDRAVCHALQGIGNRDGGDRAGSAFERRQQGRDGPRGDQRSRRVVHEDDVGLRRRQSLQSGPHAVLARRAARYRRQMSQAAERRIDRCGVTDRLQQRHVCGQSLGGMADHRLAGERHELLRRLGAEPAAGPGCHQDRCYPHSGTVAGANGRRQSGADTTAVVAKIISISIRRCLP